MQEKKVRSTGYFINKNNLGVSLRVGLYVPAFFEAKKNRLKKELHCHPSRKPNVNLDLTGFYPDASGLLGLFKESMIPARFPKPCRYTLK
jgi:hypothetical protein